MVKKSPPASIGPHRQDTAGHQGLNKEKNVRIAIMGQAAFGAKVLETLSDRGEEIIAAWLPQGKAGGKIDPLQTAAESR